MEQIICRFNDISEKDMDILFLEEFIASEDFADLFLRCTGLRGAHIIETEHSKVDVEYGESDLTVIVEKNGKRHALLIEDKIDAVAMPEQANRYFERGKLGISEGEYESFDVFIVAPTKYLKENLEAQHYPNQVSYEEIAEFFSKQTEPRYIFKHKMIMQAMHKQKTGYQVKENKQVTEFWEAYIDFQRENYPSLWLSMRKGAKGSKSSWAYFKTTDKNVWIYHKCEKGFIDLTFDGLGDKISELEEIINNCNINLNAEGVGLVKTGKAAALRKFVPIVNVKEPFTEQTEKIAQCFQTVEQLNSLAKIINNAVR